MSNLMPMSMTDCPSCGQMCVGPALLPCSHLLCHRCLLHVLDRESDQAPDCPFCGHALSPTHTTGQRQVEQFPTDVVMEHLVMEQLVQKSGGRCCVSHEPPSRPPSHLCLQCSEVFCESCSHVHLTISATKGHTLKPLKSQESSIDPRSQPSTPKSDDEGSARNIQMQGDEYSAWNIQMQGDEYSAGNIQKQDEEYSTGNIQKHGDEDSTRNTLKPCDEDSALNIQKQGDEDSAGSNQNQDDEDSARDTDKQGDEVSIGDNRENTIQDAIRKETQLFQKTLWAWDEMLEGMELIRTHRQGQRHVLNAYGQHLFRDDVSIDEVTLQRFRYVREECQAVFEADVDNLFQMESRRKSDCQAVSASVERRLDEPHAQIPEQHTQMPCKHHSVVVCVVLSVLVSFLLALLLLTPPPACEHPGDLSSVFTMNEHKANAQVMTEETSSAALVVTGHKANAHVMTEDRSSAALVTNGYKANAHVMTEDTSSAALVTNGYKANAHVMTEDSSQALVRYKDSTYGDTKPGCITKETSAHLMAKDTSSSEVMSEDSSSENIKSEDSSSEHVMPQDTGSDPSVDDLRFSTSIHYIADSVILQPADSESTSLIGAVCENGCSLKYDDWITDALATSEGRVVLAMYLRHSLEVQSSSGVQTVKLGCSPGGVAELPSRRLAVTCPNTPAVLLVNWQSSNPRIQRIPTEKHYWRVAAHPTDPTLIASTWPEPSIDIITLQGKVVRTLVDGHQGGLQSISSLTVFRESLLVTYDGKTEVHFVQLSSSSQFLWKALAGSFTSDPVDTAVDTAGNVFIVLRDGGVLVTDFNGHFRWLLNEEGSWFVSYVKWRSIAVQDNRLLMVTSTYQLMFSTSDVTEHLLVDQ